MQLHNRQGSPETYSAIILYLERIFGRAGLYPEGNPAGVAGSGFIIYTEFILCPVISKCGAEFNYLCPES